MRWRPSRTPAGRRGGLEENLGYFVEIHVNFAVGADGPGKGDFDDIAALEAGHESPALVADHVHGGNSEAGGEDAVEHGRWTAALDMAKHGDAGFHAGAVADGVGETAAEFFGSEVDVAELVAGRDAGLGLFETVDAGAFGDDDDAEILTLIPPHVETFDDVLKLGSDLRDDDVVGAAGETADGGDPTGFAAHDLDDHGTMVGAGGSVEVVECLGDAGDGGIESDAVVGALDVVVHGLGNADYWMAVGGELVGHGKGVVAADGDEGVEADFFENGTGHGVSLFVGAGVGARGAEHGAALVEDAGDVVRGHPKVVALEDSGPAIAKSLDLPAQQRGFSDDGADGGVKTGTVSAAGENPNFELVLR